MSSVNEGVSRMLQTRKKRRCGCTTGRHPPAFSAQARTGSHMAYSHTSFLSFCWNTVCWRCYSCPGKSMLCAVNPVRPAVGTGPCNGHPKQIHGWEPHQVIVTKDFPVAVDLVVLGLDMLHVGEADISCLHGITTLTQPFCQRCCPASKTLLTKKLLFLNENS